ncbi:MAG: DegV family protein [Eubacteriales bacterium]|nr:DegV family protein [Eubacteriales bacterium]
MKNIGIITDSHSGLTPRQAQELGVLVLPMPFYINGECYYENVTLSREVFFEKLSQGAEVSTSQPSPEEVKALWRKGLEQYDELLYMPISSGLSGSCMTAAAMAGDSEFNNKVFVVDHGRVSTPLVRTIMDALELIQEGYTASQIKDILEASKNDMVIYIALETLEYLKKGGRISTMTAALGTLLNVKPVLKLETGILESFQKCRGFKKARKLMIDTMKKDIETRFHDSLEKGELSLLAASSASPEITAEWVKEIEEAFPGMSVLSGNLSLGICCHTGPGGLGIGCSCRPSRPE